MAELRTDLHFALVVGINKYPGLPTSLRGPRNDAQAFRAWLESEEGGRVPKGNVRHVDVDPDKITAVASAQPTREAINGALKELMTAAEKLLEKAPQDWPHTRLYVYLSGHGVTPSANEAALLAANVELDALGDSIPCSAYMEYFQERQTFRELVFFADCCRTLKMQAQLLPPPWNRVKSQRGNVSTLMGFATAYGTLAYEPTPQEIADPDLVRGHFTKALLEGLTGSAADPDTGEITSERLGRYVFQRVLDLTRNKSTPQEPKVLTDVAAPIVFRSQTPIPLHTITVLFRDRNSGEVILTDARGQQRATHDIATGSWSLKLPNGFYQVQLAGGPPDPPLQNDGLFRVTGADRVVTV